MISYAQNFEDVMLERVFRDVADGFYVDVGAWHPIRDSVTMHFYSKGWSGINIEPAADAYALLQVYRPRDINLNVAAGDAEEEEVFYETPGLGLSTLNRGFGEEYLQTYPDVTRSLVRVTTLKAICEAHVHREIDFLKIDAEGAETAVIRGGDWQRFRPRIVLVEAIAPRTLEPTWESWDQLLLERDYDFAFFDGLNRYYVRSEDACLGRHLLVPPNLLDRYTTYEEARLRIERDQCRAALMAYRHDPSKNTDSFAARPILLIRNALRRSMMLTSLLKVLDRARMEANELGCVQGARHERLVNKGLGSVWRAVRRTIPKEMRRRTHDRLLRLAAPEPLQRRAETRRFNECRQARFGINIIGHLSAESGLGEAARGSARAAQAVDIPAALLDFSYATESRAGERVPGVLSERPKYPFTLFQFNGGEMVPESRVWTLCELSKGYNIGVWFWETTEMPDSWLTAVPYLDEIWAASTFCLDVFARKSSIPVVRIPVSVEPVRPADLSREELGLPPKGFLFLSMADFFSTPERKNPLGALKAFHRAFGSTKEEVYLVLKVSNSKHRPEVLEIMNRWVKGDSRIILIEGYMDRPELNALIKSCDCLVSLHRSEGFGLPIAEAMYMGKPTIATGWSANMDFMTIDNSLPVRYRLIPVNEHSGPYKDCQGLWADPDIDHAAFQMRRVVSDESSAKILGQAACETIREHFSPVAVGRLIRERLCFIRNRVW